MSRSHLLVLGHPAGLAWVLTNAQMAFTDARLSQARKLRPDDRLLLYASKRAFGNSPPPTGLVIGQATVKCAVRRMEVPVRIGPMSYGLVVDFALDLLAPFGRGVHLSEHLEHLELFPDPKNWTSRIRRTVVSLPHKDANFLITKLGSVTVPSKSVLKQYQDFASSHEARSRARDSQRQDPTVGGPRDNSFLLDLLVS